MEYAQEGRLVQRGAKGTHMERITARRRDLDQSLEEQAFAAAHALRWHQIDHPHLRLCCQPQWQLTGCRLDEKSERYLLMLTQERISEMRRRLGAPV